MESPYVEHLTQSRADWMTLSSPQDIIPSRRGAFFFPFFWLDLPFPKGNSCPFPTKKASRGGVAKCPAPNEVGILKYCQVSVFLLKYKLTRTAPSFLRLFETTVDIEPIRLTRETARRLISLPEPESRPSSSRSILDPQAVLFAAHPVFLSRVLAEKSVIAVFLLLVRRGLRCWYTVWSSYFWEGHLTGYWTLVASSTPMTDSGLSSLPLA